MRGIRVTALLPCLGLVCNLARAPKRIRRVRWLWSCPQPSGGLSLRDVPFCFQGRTCPHRSAPVDLSLDSPFLLGSRWQAGASTVVVLHRENESFQAFAKQRVGADPPPP